VSRPLTTLLALLALTAPALAAPDLLTRPRVELAVGMGGSIDRAAPNPYPDRPVPSFFFTAGVGAGLLGLDLRSFANGATKLQVTRLSFELVLVARPLVLLLDESHYVGRVARSAALELGPASERVSQDVKSDWRPGLVVGGHLDLPIGPAARKELRVRLGVRRMFGTTGTVGGLRVSDTTLELYGQLAFVF
jgi:hypothetical protein